MQLLVLDVSIARQLFIYLVEFYSNLYWANVLKIIYKNFVYKTILLLSFDQNAFPISVH